jgi:hypothetical protein
VRCPPAGATGNGRTKLKVSAGPCVGGITGRHGRAELPGWAHPAVAAEHAKAAALSATEQAARRLPGDADRLGFEQRNERLAEVLDELVDVEPAEATLRSLRRRTADQPALACPAGAAGAQARETVATMCHHPEVGAEEGAG